MISSPSFSVLLSLYYKERPELLCQSLDSVFNQTLHPDEVVLVEDGVLTRELYSLLDNYERYHSNFKRVSLPANGGLGKALNEGLKHCSYELVARMDTDDICFPDRFEKQLKFMTEHPEISVCSSWVDEFIDSKDNVVSKKILPETHEEIFEYGKDRCPINHPAVIFRKQAVIDAGGYGEFPEDYSLWGRMLKQGFRFYNMQESLLWFRTSKDVFHRRGGWQYVEAIYRLEKELFNINYISFPRFVKNVLFRSIIAIIPNDLRSYFYRVWLRTK